MKVAATTAMSMGLAGCLAAQDYDREVPFIQINRSPMIIQSATRASDQAGSYVELQTACDVWFEAVVEDPDVDDRVEFRWYVTQLPDEPEATRPPRKFVTDGYLRNTLGAVRAPERIDFKSGQVVNELSVKGTYLVEFMAFDGPLLLSQGPGSVPDPEPIPEIDGGLNPRFSTSYAWTVKMVVGACELEPAP